MEPTQPVNPVTPLDPAVIKAIGIFIQELGFEVEHAILENWAYAPLPQIERQIWIRVAGEEQSQRGRINLFDLCQTLERTPRGSWYSPLINLVNSARADAGIFPMNDWPAIIGIQAQTMKAWRLMVQV